MSTCSHLSCSNKPWAGMSYWHRLRGEDSEGEDGQVKKYFLSLETKYRYRRVVWCDHHRRLGRQPQWNGFWQDCKFMDWYYQYWKYCQYCVFFVGSSILFISLYPGTWSLNFIRHYWLNLQRNRTYYIYFYPWRCRPGPGGERGTAGGWLVGTSRPAAPHSPGCCVSSSARTW